MLGRGHSVPALQKWELWAQSRRKSISYLSGFPATSAQSWPSGGCHYDSCSDSHSPAGSRPPGEGLQGSSRYFPPEARGDKVAGIGLDVPVSCVRDSPLIESFLHHADNGERRPGWLTPQGLRWLWVGFFFLRHPEDRNLSCSISPSPPPPTSHPLLQLRVWKTRHIWKC